MKYFIFGSHYAGPLTWYDWKGAYTLMGIPYGWFYNDSHMGATSLKVIRLGL